MQNHTDESADFGAYFTHENLLMVQEPVSFDELTHQLLVNLAVTVGIGNVESIDRQYLWRYTQHHAEQLGKNLWTSHFRLTHIDTLQLAAAVLLVEVTTATGSIANPSLFILFATPHNRPDLYYRAKGALQPLIDSPTTIQQIISQPNAMAVWEQVNALNLKLSPFVQARQIMQETRKAINDTDNLETAIDQLFKHKARCLPVVDKDNELVGEVSLNDILEVCFPRHILWMDDITPILQFESFRNLLNNESVTWLAEILNQQVATIQPGDAAVKAAIEMAKHKADHVYVVNNKTLTGIITLKGLSQMILRQ
jgi:CBS domain-containing protein